VGNGNCKESSDIPVVLIKKVREISSDVMNTLLHSYKHNYLISCLLADDLNKDITRKIIRWTGFVETEGARRSREK
jgi:hypothetical protein